MRDALGHLVQDGEVGGGARLEVAQLAADVALQRGVAELKGDVPKLAALTRLEKR